MNKYAFIHGATEDVEVWRYIDDPKEARTYWYVSYAMDKYGVENTLPILMNRMGGYHTAHSESIICIIESESWPSLGTRRQFIPLVNNPKFTCGWIDAVGNTYRCAEYQHLNMAEDIANEYYHDAWVKFRSKHHNCPDDFLLEMGFIKIDAGKNAHFLDRYVTNSAIKTLDELQRLWDSK